MGVDGRMDAIMDGLGLILGVNRWMDWLDGMGWDERMEWNARRIPDMNGSRGGDTIGATVS